MLRRKRTPRIIVSQTTVRQKRELSFSASPGPPASGLTESRSAVARCSAWGQGRSSGRPRRRTLPKGSSSQATVKQIIGLLPACCGENARRGSLPVKQPSGRSESFLSRRRPDPPASGLTESRSAVAPCSARSRTVPPGVQDEERFPRTVPVKQQSSKQSIYFQHVTEKTHAADHCQSNNRQAEARAFFLGVARTARERAYGKPLSGRALLRLGPRPFLRASKATNASQGQFQSSNSQANNRFTSSMLRRKRTPRIIASQTTVRQKRRRFFLGDARIARKRDLRKADGCLRPAPHGTGPFL